MDGEVIEPHGITYLLSRHLHSVGKGDPVNEHGAWRIRVLQGAQRHRQWMYISSERAAASRYWRYACTMSIVFFLYTSVKLRLPILISAIPSLQRLDPLAFPLPLQPLLPQTQGPTQPAPSQHHPSHPPPSQNYPETPLHPTLSFSDPRSPPPPYPKPHQTHRHPTQQGPSV